MKVKKVLVIDDDLDVSKLISDFLISKGYETIIAKDGAEGLRICRDEKPDFITLDLFMPKIDGVKFLEMLHKDPKISSIPVVVVSVVAEQKKQDVQLFHLGIVDWLSKPIDFDHLLKIIKDSENLLPEKLEALKKVVVIEDDGNVAEVFSTFLQTRGYNAVIFNTGINIVENIIKEKPTMVLLDVLMPDIDGVEIIKILKSNPETADVPVVVISGLDVYEYRKRCILAGATEYYVGSFSSETFLNELQGNILKYEMMRAQKYAKILVADDDHDLANIAIDNLTVEGFEVIYACDGEEAVKLTYKEMPDLILLDINMPKKDGYQAFKEIKADILLSNLPIILLTAKGKTREKILGLELGADDYITKPYDVEELIARVKMILRRTSSNIEANPLTKLPGNVSIEQTINDSIKKKKPFAVLYIDINNFKAFNDKYGFNRGDEVIRSTARTLLESLNELSWRDDFVGHIGGDDFILISQPDRIDTLCKRIIEKYNKLAPSFYDEEDKIRGYITTKDRQGNIMNFPIVSLAIGVATTANREFNSLGEVARIGTEMKSFAKKFKDKGSYYAIDARKS